MQDNDYPALYKATNQASLDAQSNHLKNVKRYIVLSVCGACLSIISIQSKVLAILSAIFFLGGLGVSLLLYFNKKEDTWYRARAVAESIKTSTWRFMMRAEPFNTLDLEEAKAKFRKILDKILYEHKDLAHDLAYEFSSHKQITKIMVENRERPLSDRINTYLDDRVKDQQKWYTAKAKYNKTAGNFWFTAFLLLQALLVFSIIMRVAYPKWNCWPTEALAVAATGILSWIQLKRFRELAASYSLAAYEIGIASESSDSIKTEDDFASFVRDTENAFSREHTQWIAKRNK